MFVRSGGLAASPKMVLPTISHSQAGQVWEGTYSSSWRDVCTRRRSSRSCGTMCVQCASRKPVPYRRDRRTATINGRLGRQRELYSRSFREGEGAEVQQTRGGGGEVITVPRTTGIKVPTYSPSSTTPSLAVGTNTAAAHLRVRRTEYYKQLLKNEKYQ